MQPVNRGSGNIQSTRNKIRKPSHFYPIIIFVTTILALMLPAVEGNADTVQSLFDQANQKLQDGYYDRALNIYHTIEERDTVSGSLYLNMGIAYTYLDSLGKAKFYLLKARTFPSTREPAQEGLTYVNNQFSNQSAVLPKLPWERAIDWLQNNWGIANTFLIGFLLLILSVSGILYSWFFSRFRWSVNLGSRITAGLGILIVVLSLYMNYLDQRYTQAVMTQQETVVKQKPTLDATTVSKAYEGYTFTVDLRRSQDQEQWYYVRLPNGMNGWIQKNQIKVM